MLPQAVEHGTARKPREAGTEKPPQGGLLAERSAPLVAAIDDNPDIVEALTDALRERGYRALGFRSGEEALRVLELGETPSLIVLDLMMPEMDGWTFRVRQRASAKLKDVPLIVMSACASPQAQAIHADAYLRKPLSMDRMCAVIEQALASAERRKLLTHSLEIERLRSLGMLVASVAHEISNPLTYVSGNIALAANACGRGINAPDPKDVLRCISRFLEDASHGADRISEIVRSLLVFARSESPSAGSADIGRALQGAVRLASAYTHSKAALHCNVPELPRVLGDEARLGQVFLNLLINATQAMAPGSADENAIAVSARREGSYLMVEVSDTGCGISEENLARVFEPFFTTKPAGEGTGIGLSFCKGVVEESGGTISVRSHVGAGTIFTVKLQVAADNQQLCS